MHDPDIERKSRFYRIIQQGHNKLQANVHDVRTAARRKEKDVVASAPIRPWWQQLTTQG